MPPFVVYLIICRWLTQFIKVVTIRRTCSSISNTRSAGGVAFVGSHLDYTAYRDLIQEGRKENRDEDCRCRKHKRDEDDEVHKKTEKGRELRESKYSREHDEERESRRGDRVIDMLTTQREPDMIVRGGMMVDVPGTDPVRSGNHLGQHSHGFRWPYGPVRHVTEYKDCQVPMVLEALERMHAHLTADVVSNDPLFNWMEGYVLRPSESTRILKDNDIIWSG
ncbi:hypothetical protein CTI12_AA296350 [Artemisia annua]|uniref:Uncharacterized protein n=1 Tax=Artemisia annua TaxID=35608 RepID=A0A2U1N7A6_ARTAN|nr:hypothetical protein CTI12_AA296350 [Artemisia annua]